MTPGKRNYDSPHEKAVPAFEAKYKPVRLGEGYKALAALDVGLLSFIKEKIFTSDEEWQKRKQDEGSAGAWMLKEFASKALAGYRAAEAAEYILDEGQFADIQAYYRGLIEDAQTDEERRELARTFEAIKRDRDRKLAQDSRNNQTLQSALGVFADIFK